MIMITETVMMMMIVMMWVVWIIKIDISDVLKLSKQLCMRSSREICTKFKSGILLLIYSVNARNPVAYLNYLWWSSLDEIFATFSGWYCGYLRFSLQINQINIGCLHWCSWNVIRTAGKIKMN
jgi:hypothetical protein